MILDVCKLCIFNLLCKGLRYTVLLRSLLTPLMFICALGVTSDVLSIMAVATFGLFNGYSGSLSLRLSNFKTFI